MTLPEIITAAETLHVEIDKALAAAQAAQKPAPWLTKARALASEAIGQLNAHAAANPPSVPPSPPPSGQ